MKIKLIGARRYSCPPMGLVGIEQGSIVDVSKEDAEELLKQTWVDTANNEKPLFTKDLEAKNFSIGQSLRALGDNTSDKDDEIEELKRQLAEAKAEKSAPAKESSSKEDKPAAKARRKPSAE